VVGGAATVARAFFTMATKIPRLTIVASAVQRMIERWCTTTTSRAMDARTEARRVLNPCAIALLVAIGPIHIGLAIRASFVPTRVNSFARTGAIAMYTTVARTRCHGARAVARGAL